MIKAVEFKNFKILRDTSLPLGRCTILIGPNGSGKSTALAGIAAFTADPPLVRKDVRSAAATTTDVVEVRLHFGGAHDGITKYIQPNESGPPTIGADPGPDGNTHIIEIDAFASHTRVFDFQPSAIAAPGELSSEPELKSDGHGLAGVLDWLRNRHPERLSRIVEEFTTWLPEFDEVLFDVIESKNKTFSLRGRSTSAEIPARALASGALTALAILTLAHLPNPPAVIGLEEPDRGLHPRLLRDVQQAIYRLCYPQDFGEDREPVQVVATTHSPYFLDLFKEHPEEVVICQREGDNVHFTRLSDLPHVEEILDGSSLGDVWYSGILGGVPTGQ